MKYAIVENLQRLGLMLATWVCVACASGAAPKPVAPVRASCEGDFSAVAIDDYAGCQEVVGDLRIEHSDPSDLRVLSRLRSVTGTLFLNANPKLESLRGLENLQQAGEVVILDNPRLSDVSALKSLELVQRLSIAHNPRLKVLSGVDALKHVESLSIMKNGLTRVKGFARLESAGHLSITENELLIYISGFENLATVDDLSLENNPRLAPKPSLFPSLGSVEGRLDLAGSPGIAESALLSAAQQSRGETASR